MIYSAIKKSKINFAFMVSAFALAILIAIIDKGIWGPGKIWFWSNLFSFILNGFVVFGIGRGKEPGKDDKYSIIVSELSSMTANLSRLKAFLESEQKRVAYTKEFIVKLEQEKKELEPVVISHRETVEAILNAYNSKKGVSKWSGPIWGFIVGVLSSVTATYIIKFFK